MRGAATARGERCGCIFHILISLFTTGHYARRVFRRFRGRVQVDGKPAAANRASPPSERPPFPKSVFASNFITAPTTIPTAWVGWSSTAAPCRCFSMSCPCAWAAAHRPSGPPVSWPTRLAHRTRRPGNRLHPGRRPLREPWPADHRGRPRLGNRQARECMMDSMMDGIPMDNRAGSPLAPPAAHHRGRAWDPFPGSHICLVENRTVPKVRWVIP
jgi:hypothetical protein